jgi:hypothetical protein
VTCCGAGSSQSGSLSRLTGSTGKPLQLSQLTSHMPPACWPARRWADPRVALLPQVGPLDAKAKARKVAQRREKQALAELTRPDQLEVTLLPHTWCNVRHMWYTDAQAVL